MVTFQRNQLQQLMSRAKRFKLACNVPLHRDCATAEYTILYLQMVTGVKLPINNFESVKSFKYYFPKNNHEYLLHKFETYYKPNTKKIQDLSKVFSKLLKYMMYPYDYIEKYKFGAVRALEKNATYFTHASQTEVTE